MNNFERNKSVDNNQTRKHEKGKKKREKKQEKKKEFGG